MPDEIEEITDSKPAKKDVAPTGNPNHVRRTINGREVLWDKQIKGPVIETGKK